MGRLAAHNGPPKGRAGSIPAPRTNPTILMQIEKSISSECAVCGKNAELHDHYYAIGSVNNPTRIRWVIAPSYYDDKKDEGFCSPNCSNVKMSYK